jgi:hypothetical protein
MGQRVNKPSVSAQVKMKALVVSRLLQGDIADWSAFVAEREAANKIFNRAIARNVSSQIGWKYSHLSTETRNFIETNFVGCEYHNLARLCDEISPGEGISIRLDEFEKEFFCLKKSVKERFPYYAQVRISTYGLQFEFPEHHFLRDIETAVPELLETQSRMRPFKRLNHNAKRDRELIGGLVAREKFLSRSMISAAFSLVEAFLSGLFFTAVHTKWFGSLICDDEFLKYAATKESDALSRRLDRAIRFVSKGAECGTDEPFRSLMNIGKRYRDAIHHTTPFERKDVKAGGRLSALYEINTDIAFRCVLLSCEAVLKISLAAFGTFSSTDISTRCSELHKNVTAAIASKELRGAEA